MTRPMTRVRLTHRRGGDTIGAKQECPDRWSSCAHGLTPSEALQVMNRILLVTLFLLPPLLAMRVDAQAAETARRPNILLIVSEDNGPELGCYGDPYAHAEPGPTGRRGPSNAHEITSSFSISPLTPTLSPEYRGEGVIS